jgi:hypothetical protein
MSRRVTRPVSRGRRIGLGLRRLRVAPGEHVAYLWRTEAEFRAAVQFLELGLRRREVAVLFGYPVANARICAELARRGHVWRGLVDSRQLIVVNARRPGPAALARLVRMLRGEVRRGTRGIRVLGNVGWGHPGWPPLDQLLVYEARLIEAVAPFDSVVMCMYQMSARSGATLLWTAFGTHALTLYGTTARRNPYYVPVPAAARNPARARTGALPARGRSRADLAALAAATWSTPVRPSAADRPAAYPRESNGR